MFMGLCIVLIFCCTKFQLDTQFTEFISIWHCSTCFGRYCHPSSGAQNNCNYSIYQLELELIWVCCGWRTPSTTHSNQLQLFHDSSRQQYGITVTRCCSYSCFVLLTMGDSSARNMYSRVRLVDWYRGYGATTPSHLGRKLAGPLCTAFSSARQPQRRSTSSDMRALVCLYSTWFSCNKCLYSGKDFMLTLYIFSHRLVYCVYN